MKKQHLLNSQLGLSVGVVLLSCLATAQSLSPISTDRPTFSDGASLVAPGHWQFESGTTVDWLSGTKTNTYGELLTRYGFSSRVEFRLANVTWTHVSGLQDGFQDPAVGVKLWIQTGSLKRPDLSVEFMTTLPAGGSAYRVDRTQPTAKLIWNQQIDADTTITGNFVISDLGPNGARFTQWAQSAFLTRAISSKLSAFAEAYRIEPNGYGSSSSDFYDAGLTYLLTNNLQLDARFGSGFNPETDGHFVGAGVSYRY